MKVKNKKIFITGGHLAPAVALIEEIQSQQLPWTVIFIGRNNSFEGTKSVSREQQSIREKGVRFIPITTGRIQRATSLNSLLSLCKIPLGIFQAFLYCIIVSFGGYIAVPVTLAGWILGIPVITHEQTLVPGLANRMIARIARVVCITFEETARYFPENKVRYTGLPVRRAILERAQKNPFPVLNKQLPLLYITGGTTGSQSINDLVFPILPDLLHAIR
jgi:UDP-N-acetylglucosamine--N-acetylmuramyl-(pentapeptide) pyrophosphoryl-undecaprenol N-acetylglucosamine transferase